MPAPPPAPDQPPALPPGMDALSIGLAALSGRIPPQPPVVEGFTAITWLAEGGFGKVWRAIRQGDGHPVAIKVPHLTDPETADHFDQEAEALKALNHHNIVRLLDVTATEDAHPVLVMELVDGPPLTARLLRGGFDFGQTLRIFIPVLDAVAHAHARGIVHRDLKPGNILIAPDGTPKITDFGLAQPLQDQRVSFSLTMSGALAGTIEYIAPERYEPDARAGTAADIYALGVILYELLTGRPPRGAWQPPSQVKQLDVRLDELILHAIHAHPAQRLASAEAFKKRLEEIRDTRPRYAGTPLVSRAVRITDALWTCTGLYMLAAGFCSLQKINNTQVPGVFDLTFGHTKHLGGYWALWVLCVGMGLVWMWQCIRLWRFRHIPLREALPCPFGLRLSHSRGAAALVAGCQLLCAWLPLLYMGWLYSQCWFWAGPDTAPWEKVLAITRWGSEVPLSQWTWATEGMFSGDEFWIREMQGGMTPGTWVQLDRQSFFVFTQPLLMALALAAIAMGLTATIIACWMQWARRKPLRLISLALLTGLCLFSVTTAVSAEKEGRQELRTDHAKGRLRTDRASQHALFPGLMQTFAAAYAPEPAFRQHFPRNLADRIKLTDTTSMSRGEFMQELERRRGLADAVHRTIEAQRLVVEHDATRDSLPVVMVARIFDAPPGGPVSAFFIRTSLACRRTPPEAAGTIATWAEEITPFYTATAEPLAESTASAWLDAFLRALSARDLAALHSMMLPFMLQFDPIGAGNHPPCPDEYQAAPAPREQLTTPLLASLAQWPAATFTSLHSPALRPLPGARWQLTCPIRQTGTRPTGEPSTRDLEWIIELVFTGGQWQALRVRM